MGRWAAAAVALVALAGSAWAWWNASPSSATLLADGLAAASRGDLPAARICLARLRQRPGSESSVTLLRGVLLVKNDYAYPALTELTKVQDVPACRAAALVARGEAWYRLGRQVEAQADWQRALELDANAVDVHRWLGASYYDLGAIHNAIHHLQRVAALDEEDYRSLRLLGLIHKDYERYDEAIGFYQEALRRGSSEAVAAAVREELAECQLKVRKFQEALASLTPCAPSPRVLALRAEAHWGSGQIAEASRLLEQSLAEDPAHVESLLLRGTILLEENKSAAAIAALESAVAAAPRDHRGHMKLAQALALAGRQAEAAAEQKRSDHLREVRRVFAELHEAAWDNPEDAQVRLRLAQLAGELGRPDLEQVWLKAASALQPAGATAGAVP
jgi:tetratricopeptide (TPR) repeat protein